MMRRSDPTAITAILFGTALGLGVMGEVRIESRHDTTTTIHVVSVVEPVEWTYEHQPPELEAREVTLTVTSVDPDREASFELLLEDYATGQSTRAVTPFTLTTTLTALTGFLLSEADQPELRADMTTNPLGSTASVTASAMGRSLRLDSSMGELVVRRR